MKRNVLLLTNWASNRSVPGEKDEVKPEDEQRTFDVLSLALEDIDLAIVDLGASTQSLAIVETLSHRQPAPPVIALVDGQDSEAMVSFQEHGAAACLTKPFSADELARIIQVVCAPRERESDAVHHD